MKKIFFSILLILSINFAYSQQDAQFSHYMFNNVAFNPAYAGMNGEICMNFTSHQQWRGLEGAPISNLMTVDSNVKLLGQEGGVGLKILDDRVGFVQNFMVSGIFSYHKSIGLGTLGIGFDLGIFNKLFKPEWEFPDQSESILPTDSRKMIFDMSGGLFYKLDNLYIGLSSTHLIRPKFNFDAITDGGSGSQIFLTNHYYLTGAYNIQLANALLDFTPSFLVKSDGVSLQTDINLMLLYNKKFWTAVTYRNEDALVFFAGTSVFNNLRLGLSYDVTISRIRTVSTGTFEVNVGYCFSFGNPGNAQKYHNVKSL